MDDSTSSAPSDAWGIINRATKTDGWFGLADTFNDQNPTGDVTATWDFDVSGASALEVSIDMGAMGNFELADVFNWTFSIDGDPFAPLFTSSVNEGGTANYTLADGDVFAVIDPVSMTVAGGPTVQLSNILQTLTASIVGTGDVLALRFDGNTNGDDEAYAFDNIVVTGLLPSFAAADFNDDGFVDVDDLAAWQTNFGTPSGAAKNQGDADLDGDVDGADFLAWQQQWTGVGAGVAAAAAVPEPSSVLLLLMAWLACGRRRTNGQG